MPEKNAMRHYLRLEGVNLSNFIDDTEDLSTRRGGSLLLLEAVRAVGEEISKRIQGVKANPITTGASAGLYELELSGGASPQAVLGQVEAVVRDWLQNSAQFRHATFVVNTGSYAENVPFVTVRESLLALNRWQQMQSPTLVVPAGEAEGPCRIDHVRPGTDAIRDAEKRELRVSQSVSARREMGRQQKQRFYEIELNRELEQNRGHEQRREPRKVLADFAQHFEELSATEEGDPLHHKMAVLYFDGNGFGKLKDQVCLEPEDLRRFDETLTKYRRELLEGLLELMARDPRWLSREDRYRLETLLWGGDELTWVVPAGLGWEVLSYFYEASASWKYLQLEPIKGGEARTKTTPHALTHGGGVVFCHHNAPIQRVNRMVHELAELAKKRSRTANFFAYQVLESFDYVGSSLEAYRQSRMPATLSAEDMVLPGEGIGQVLEHVKCLKRSDFPRRQHHALVENLLRPTKTKSENAKLESTIRGALDERGKKALKSLEALLGTGLWLHLADLWDYLG